MDKQNLLNKIKQAHPSITEEKLDAILYYATVTKYRPYSQKMNLMIKEKYNLTVSHKVIDSVIESLKALDVELKPLKEPKKATKKPIKKTGLIHFNKNTLVPTW